jgi:anti-anti-sigma factor
MTGRMLETQVCRQPPNAVVITLHGEINAGAADALNAAYAAAAQTAPAVILLDFSDVDYINSTGIALIVGLPRQQGAAQRALLACGPERALHAHLSHYPPDRLRPALSRCRQCPAQPIHAVIAATRAGGLCGATHRRGFNRRLLRADQIARTGG